MFYFSPSVFACGESTSLIRGRQITANPLLKRFFGYALVKRNFLHFRGKPGIIGKSKKEAFPMKVLILSCKTGQGHHSVANAVLEELENRGHTCEVLDALAFLGDRTARLMSWGHSFVYCHMPKAFQKGYEVAERHPAALENGSLAYRYLARGSDDLCGYIQAEQFDAVVCTHVFAALMFTDVKRRHGFSVTSCFVATDYAGYPGVDDTEMDIYFIPDDAMEMDYREKPCLVSGIPVRQTFFSSIPLEEAKEAAGIDPDKKHIVMMCGSMGCGPMEELTKCIAGRMGENCVLSVICGTNQRLHQKLTDNFGGSSRVQVLGFVQNISQLLDSADVYVTKPGGISTTEAMAKGLPMVLVDAVAGCEDYNMRYFRGIGGAVGSKEPERLASLCMELLENPARRARMSAQLLKKSRNGAKAICDYLEGIK